jgi:hypothetical protein
VQSTFGLDMATRLDLDLQIVVAWPQSGSLPLGWQPQERHYRPPARVLPCRGQLRSGVSLTFR